MPALDLLVKMQASHTHMALVIDEYGGTDGLVSIEDVVESIVGDIEDEHDEADRPQIAAAGDGAFIVEARASLEDVSKALGFDLSALADAEDVDTIGGLLTATAGRVPVRGEIVAGPGDLEFEVLDADPRRVKRLRVQPRAAPRRRNAGRARARRIEPAAGIRRSARRQIRAKNSALVDAASAPRFAAPGGLAQAVHSRLGLAAARHRFRRRRRRRARHAAHRLRAGADRADDARGVADRRRGRPRRERRTVLGLAAGGVRRRLVVGLRLFRRRPVVAGRRRFSSTPTSSPGRCRSACSACRPRSRSFPRFGFALARLIWRADATRVLALAVGLGFSEWLRCVVAHRLSLERARHGARRQSRTGADRLDRRPARADASRRGDLRRAGDAMDRDAATLAADRARGARARGDLRIRRLAR